MVIDLFEQGGICQILLFLLDKPEGVKRVEYRTSVNLGSRAAMRDHEVLFNSGLIINKPSSDQLLFTLSEKGKQVALYLKLIEQTLLHYPDSSSDKLALTDFDRTLQKEDNPIQQALVLLKDEWQKVEDQLRLEHRRTSRD